MLIVGEGRETEPNYFDGLRREDCVRHRFSIRVQRGPGGSPERVVAKAVELKQEAVNREEEYDGVWCVLDVEGPEKRSSLERAICAARQAGIALCLSNPSFEVWLLAHFERTSRAFCDAREVIGYLARYWRAHHGQDYAKDDVRVYERVADRTHAAIENARSVREKDHEPSAETADCNSSTEVYRLVERLIS